MKRTFKKSLALLLMAVMLCGFVGISFPTLANAAEVSDLTYVVNDGKVEITDCKLTADGTFIIPTTINGYPVTSIGEKAFQYCNKLSHVEIPFGVKSIGRYAFSMCTNLVDVAIPSTVTSIGDYAFQHCEKMTQVEIPSGVTSIGEGAFDECLRLESIKVATTNANYSSDEKGVLFNKNKTELIQFPIGNAATTYTIPSGVKVLGNKAFFYCTKLTGVTIPSGVTSIGNFAFFYCNHLEDIEIPSGITSFGYQVFNETAFYSDSSNWVDDVLYINEYLIEAKFAIPNPYSVKPGTTLIVRKAFDKCTGLTRLHIPSSVTIIGSDLLPANSECIFCSETNTAYAKTYAQGNGFTFEICSGHEYVSVVHVTGVTLDIASKTLAVNATQQLAATVAPTNSTYKDVSWKSSNTAVATVSSTGLVTAKAAGTATITVTTADGSKTATCTITVSNPTITIKNLNNSASINYGDTLKLTAVADMPAGAKVVWSVDGTGVSLNASDDGRTCEVTSTAGGTVTVTAKIVDASGNPITDGSGNEISVSQQIKSNAGFFQKLIAFFKKLFGSTKIIEQSIDE